MSQIDIYYKVYKIKKVQIFAIFIRNLKLQVKIKIGPETNLKSIV